MIEEKAQAGNVLFGSVEIRYSVEYRKRKTLAISVFPDNTVKVVAPLATTPAQIEAKVRRRAAWIVKKLDVYGRFDAKAPPRNYISGETHYYLGRQYRLKVHIATRTDVFFRGGYLEVHTPDKGDKAAIKKALNGWYRDKAREKLEPIFQKCLKKLPLAEPQKGTLDFRLVAMPKRWGSCTPKGNILLNPRLIKASKACIEYVILHELCHLVIPYHNAAFYELQTRLLPDWRDLKRKLDFSTW